MLSLTAHHVCKAFGITPILNNISFSINAGERVGLVGPNGCGKTTLLRLLARVDSPDSGQVQWTPPTLRVGYLPQGLAFDAADTLGAFMTRAQGDVVALESELTRCAEALTRTPQNVALQRAYDAALAQLEAVDEGRAPAVLAALGLAHLPPDLPVAALSGGQKTRLALAGVLLGDPQLLLLDEPTNHLDIEMLTWLEDWLRAFPGAALVVSHDRAFLDRAVNRILELDPATQQVKLYAGNYSDYLDEKAAETDRAWAAYTDQQEEILALRNSARHLRGLAKFRKGGKADTGDKFAKGFFANRGKGTMGRAKHIEHRLETLLTDEKIEKPKASWQLKLDFGPAPASGQDVLLLEELTVGYRVASGGGELPSSSLAAKKPEAGELAFSRSTVEEDAVVLLRDINLTLRHGARAVLTGPNGCGKTTLFRTILGQVPPLAGRARLGANVRVGYMAQEQATLEPTANALSTLRGHAPFSETEARQMLHYFLFSGDEVFTPVGSLSFGERARLALATLVVKGCNLLLLDEPLNHLDLPARARFEQALAQFGGTVLAVAHDRYFIEAFASEIWEVKMQDARFKIQKTEAAI